MKVVAPTTAFRILPGIVLNVILRTVVNLLLVESYFPMTMHAADITRGDRRVEIGDSDRLPLPRLLAFVLVERAPMALGHQVVWQGAS